MERGGCDVPRGAVAPLGIPVGDGSDRPLGEDPGTQVVQVREDAVELLDLLAEVVPGQAGRLTGDGRRPVPGPLHRPRRRPDHRPGQIAETGEQTRSLVRLRRRPPLVVGHQVDLGGSGREKARGVDVGVADPGAEVKPVARRTDQLALHHRVTTVHGDRLQERVAGANAVGVEDDDMKAPAHCTGVDHLSVGRRTHGISRRRVVVDSPVPGRPGVGGRPEGIDDGTPDGWAVGHRMRAGGVRSGRVGCDGRRPDEDHGDGQNDGHTAHWEPPGRRRPRGSAAGEMRPDDKPSGTGTRNQPGSADSSRPRRGSAGPTAAGRPDDRSVAEAPSYDQG